MKKYFVTYEIALHLKDKGFDGKCLAYFDENGKLNPIDTDFINFRDLSANLIKAPLWQQVVDWVIEKYMISIESSFVNTTLFYGWNFSIVYMSKDRPIPADFGCITGNYETKIDAIKNGIYEVLKLI